MTIVLSDEDRHTITATINWFATEAYNKFSRGVIEHGGTLTHKGGLLNELEMECLDHVIYARAIRDQLEGILDALNRGAVEDAKTSLRMLVRGKTSDRLPSAL